MSRRYTADQIWKGYRELFLRFKRPPVSTELAEELSIPPSSMRSRMQELERIGILVNKGGTYWPPDEEHAKIHEEIAGLIRKEIAKGARRAG